MKGFVGASGVGAEIEAALLRMPCGRQVLRDRLSDIYETLLDAGAQDVDMRRKLPGATKPEDADLQFLTVR